ncbi:MAG: sulfatase-like hydrolase/transferase [Deltaproteobacteria bacterium]|nr:sulfatase-like hydrolase/transferase [Deltaproteobacteria bacterium]
MTAPSKTRPNIVLIVSDQERSRAWLPADVSLPNRERLIREGVECTRYYTHSSPCSPSRATLFTGQYVPEHGVRENVIFPAHNELDPNIQTLGHRLRGAGYRTAYVGKWHLARGPHPDMERYGFGDWEGNDQHFMGWAGTGVQYDPVIAAQAAQWLTNNAQDSAQPWCLVVGLVNPHDVMWYPADQPFYQRERAEEVNRFKDMLRFANWKDGDPIPAFEQDYPQYFSELPANFADDLHTKPAVQREWMIEQQRSFWGEIPRDDKRSWLRQLDYYVALHKLADESLGTILSALDKSDTAENTAVFFTSDHGDMCGSHGLRSKGPFVYEEIMRIPMYAKIPGVTQAGSRNQALATHADLAKTLVDLGGADCTGMSGESMLTSLGDGSAVQEHVLFAQDQAWYERCIHVRYAIRGIFDGRFKYARYYGVGGGTTQFGQAWEWDKRVSEDAAFEDQDHELYDLQEDPHELVNLAMDRGQRQRVRQWFERLREVEQSAYRGRERGTR